MIEEVRIFGIYMPSPLLWAVLAAVLTFMIRPLLVRIPLHRVLWHPALLDLALFQLFWWGLGLLADGCLPHGLIS
jgi:hypothetical protein